jgi:16S rRNA processing protein RimM
VARLEGVNDRDAAERLNGVELYADRELLPPTEDEDDFYHADLIGLDARLADGAVLGQVIAVPNFGAGDLIEIRDPRSGDTYLYPFTRKVVPEVHLKQGYLVIEVPVETEPGDEEPD